MKENPEKFLPEKYPELPGSKPVERAVQKKLRAGEKGPQTKEARVEAYMERIEKILSSGNKISDERGWELLKNKLIKEFTIDADDPDSLAKIAYALYESEKKIAIEQGRGAEIEQLERETERQGGPFRRYKQSVREKQQVQKETLTEWLNYLKTNDAEYPMWFRYFTVRNLQKMGAWEKAKGEYSKRAPLTIAPFPELNPEALGFVYKALSSGLHKEDLTGEENKEKRQKLEQLTARKDFAKLYAFAQLETAGQLNKESLKGKWIKYHQRSNPHLLEQALRKKNTHWCTAEGSAPAHLQRGDFYAYYTQNPKTGQYTEPRIAIRMAGEQITEIRGIEAGQELEVAMAPALEEKLKEFGPKADAYRKKAADMKKMTELDNKSFGKDKKTGEETYLNPKLTKEELEFLYEINSPIEGFGYRKDPRIKELRSQRNPEKDMLIIFEATPDQIAKNFQEINENTKAYVGPLQEGIFERIQRLTPNLEHIYTSFPEGRIKRETIEIGGKSEKELEQDLEKAKINVFPSARDMMRNKDFTVSQNKEKTDLIPLKVRDLFPDNKVHATKEIYQRAQELGLELCPAEVGPNYRLQYQDQPLNEWLYIAMKQITARGGGQHVFELGHGVDGLRLLGRWAHPSSEWYPFYSFVFRLRKLKSSKT